MSNIRIKAVIELCSSEGIVTQSFDMSENIDISNNDAELRKRDASYLISTYALRTIGVVNRGLLCWIENNMLNDTIIQLQEEKLRL